jgi:hypothetical protein
MGACKNAPLMSIFVTTRQRFSLAKATVDLNSLREMDDDTLAFATSAGTTSIFYDDQFVDYKDGDDIDAHDHPRLVVKVNYEDAMDYSRLPEQS